MRLGSALALLASAGASDPHPAAAAAAAAAANSSCADVLRDTALGGHNIKDKSYVDKTMNISRCCALCDSLPNCVGWTLDKRETRCFVKDRIDKKPTSPAGGSISAKRPGVKPPPPEPVPGPPKVHPVPGDHPVAPPPGAKNVLFLICDDMRPQLGACAYPPANSPRLTPARRVLCCQTATTSCTRRTSTT